MTESKRIKAIKTASWIGIGGNAFLALAKLFTGIFAGSLSVVADGIDSSSDVITFCITLYIARLIAKPPNLKFPYGYAKAETNATSALAFIIFFAGAQLAMTSTRRLISGEISEMPGKITLVVMVVSIIGKLLLAWQQHYIGKKINSSMLIANAKNMQSDVLISSAVLAGLIATYVFKIPVLDSIAALIVSVWIIWVAIRIFLETNMELMDGNVDKSVYENVFKLADSIQGINNPHRMRIRKIGPKKMINIDIEVDGSITVSEAHRIAHDLEDLIKKNIKDVFDVAIHVEPYGDHIKEKDLGVSREELT
jgi:cation diffusion facilitator family transporter